jgi:hypothetical protein
MGCFGGIFYFSLQDRAISQGRNKHEAYGTFCTLVPCLSSFSPPIMEMTWFSEMWIYFQRNIELSTTIAVRTSNPTFILVCRGSVVGTGTMQQAGKSRVQSG